MTFAPKQFQTMVIDGLLARFRNVADFYRRVGAADEKIICQVRLKHAGVVLQAPTGAGKTAMAIDTMVRFSREENILWFWFAPFAGLVEQAMKSIRSQAPSLGLLDMGADRRLSALLPGGVFVTTWSAVAARNADARKSRTSGDLGLSLDALIDLARKQGMRIGVIVDEAHHGFHKAKQAQAFFSVVLQPDYALMMTATPRDSDVASFQRDTGFDLGDVADWASVARIDAVAEGLLKRGVRVIRFLARDSDSQQLIDFEQLALRECSQVHRRITSILAEERIGITPLMLVQVPDGKAAQLAAREYLVQTLGFAESAVRIHTSDEPDPDLIALANDPTVEVLIFKMAVAMGFDAPRAFTLAALRGARDPSFGIQVIGRIVRVHALLQGRKDLPSELDYGYVFLANAESQEGLSSAGQQINTLRTQAPEIGTALTLTYCGNHRTVQLAESGKSFALIFDEGGTVVTDEQDVLIPATNAHSESWGGAATTAQLLLAMAVAPTKPATSPLENTVTTPSQHLTEWALRAPASAHRYPRRADAPTHFQSERLPPTAADLEMRLADFVDFSESVLAGRDKSRAQVRRSSTDVFAEGRIGEDDIDLWAKLSPAAVAEKARQVLLRLADLNEREIRRRLLTQFGKAIEASVAEPPADEELLDQQLDLVLVRNPSLLREAYRRARMTEVLHLVAPQPAELGSELALPPARKNIFRVFPADMNPDERQVASLLDSHEQVLWWHRNPSDSRRADAVGLYSWDDGDGFYPDFLVAVAGRKTSHGIALLEVKGSIFWSVAKEVEKSEATHREYGRCFMIGRGRGEREFKFLRRLDDRLEQESLFDVSRMRWV